MRFLPLNLTSFLVELNDLDETLALFAALQANPLPGIKEMVPAARTLMIGFAAETTSAEALAAKLLSKLDLVAPIRRMTGSSRCRSIIMAKISGSRRAHRPDR